MAHTGYYMPSYNDVGYLVGQWRSGAVPNRHHWMVRARQYRVENMDFVVCKYAYNIVVNPQSQTLHFWWVDNVPQI